MKKWMKKIIIVLVALCLSLLGIKLWATTAVQKQLASLTYENVEMSLVRDGMYYGETKAGLVSVQVEVLVQNHTIRGIEIVEHDNGLGRKAESITLAMMQENKWAVDAVSGATLSSEAIKSAVSKALGAAQME
ncbi:MAG: FMN-binding protein [Limnochordia bacterium]|jgi:uncharacterized protein with FMN-binding domain|nr:FMN-binding protein [Bacillota bacterium]HHT89574.1 FMN-binding protein [Bacillota bacterium]